MNGRVVELELQGEAPRLLGRERLVEGRRRVRAQVVEHHADHLRVGIAHVGQMLHRMSELRPRAVLGDRYMAQAVDGREGHEAAARTLAHVLVTHACRSSGRARLPGVGVASKHEGLLVEADERAPGIRHGRGLGVEVQHVLHTPDEVGADSRGAPVLFPPRLEPIFLPVSAELCRRRSTR